MRLNAEQVAGEQNQGTIFGVCVLRGGAAPGNLQKAGKQLKKLSNAPQSLKHGGGYVCWHCMFMQHAHSILIVFTPGSFDMFGVVRHAG